MKERRIDEQGNLKYVAETLDIVQGGNANGFLAPGARVKEQPEVEAEIARIPGIKCPRCRNYHSVQGNPQELCDRCIFTILEGLPGWVEDGTFTQEEADGFRAEVKAMVNRWKRSD